MRLADYDAKHDMPQQIWYDQLRSTDDGSFSNTIMTNKLQGTDPIDYQHKGRTIENESKSKISKVKKKLMEKWNHIKNPN